MKKKLIFISLFTLASFVTFAQLNDSTEFIKNDDGKKKQQEELRTLFGSDISHGGYLAASTNYSLIDGKDALAIGGRIGWIIDHKLTLGFGGYGFANDIYVENVVNDEGYNLVGGYGGLYIEPILFPKFPVHLSFPILFGVGGIAYQTEKGYWIEDKDDGYDDYEYEYYTEDSDAFLIIEPGVEVEMNVVKNLRIALSATYRYAYDVNLINTDSDILNGLTYGVTFKIGKF